MDDELKPQEPAQPLPFATWMREGLRAGFLLRPRVSAHQPLPWQLALLLLLFTLLEIGLGRFEIPGDVNFDLRGWLAPWWNAGALLLAAWWTLPAPGDVVDSETPRGLPTWFALWAAAVVPANSVSQGLAIAQAYEVLPAWIVASPWAAWVIYLALWAWTVSVVVKLAMDFRVAPRRIMAMTAVFIGVFAITAWQFPDRAWQAEQPEAAQQARPRLELSQEAFETQQALLNKVVTDIAAERPGVVDVYGLVFSPYAQEDVFLREGRMVAQVLAERFDATGRIVHLANHASTLDSLPWATPTNLDRAVEAIAQRMDREHDVLIVYLTSHGASDFKLAAANPPLQVDTISPGDLRKALDNAGVKNRVIAISACFSGGWLGPLADEHTLVMTAADATHTSYGCGRLSELTFFGRAVFDEQLRKTHSLEQAFAAAVPIIRRREDEAGKDDGFSNPQISVGEKIKPVLRELEKRLDAGAIK